jgi:hypothetical protein
VGTFPPISVYASADYNLQVDLPQCGLYRSGGTGGGVTKPSRSVEVLSASFLPFLFLGGAGI